MLNVKVIAKNDKAAIQSVQQLPNKILLAMETGLSRGLLFAVGVSQREFLSGPRPGKVQSITGRLRGSINSSVRVNGDRVTGKAGTNLPYASFHEFGFHGVMQVRAHTRVIDQTFGSVADYVAGGSLRNIAKDAERASRRKVVSSTGEFLGLRESRKSAAKRQKTGFVTVQFVKAHSRRVEYAGKPYLRPAMQQSMPRIVEEINKDLRAVNG